MTHGAKVCACANPEPDAGVPSAQDRVCRFLVDTVMQRGYSTTMRTNTDTANKDVAIANLIGRARSRLPAPQDRDGHDACMVRLIEQAEGGNVNAVASLLMIEEIGADVR